MPQRSATQKTRRGEIMHIWRDRFRGTFYDEPKLQIQFQSGNIMPIRRLPLVEDAATRQKVRVVNPVRGRDVGVTENGVGSVLVDEEIEYVEVKGKRPDPSETQPVVPEGLDNFYEFLALVDEQKILSNGAINYVYIMYNSRMFPNLTLAGLFTPDGVSWTDSSDDPNQVTGWGANFTVYDSYPRMNDLASLRRFFELSGFGRI